MKKQHILIHAVFCSIGLMPPFENHPEERARFVAEYASSIQNKKLIAEADEGFRTLRLTPANPPSADKIRAVVQFVHGMGMSYSSASSWEIPLVIMGSDIDADPTASSTAKFLKQQPEYIHLHTEASDLPRHRLGPHGSSFEGLTPTINWIFSYFSATPHMGRPNVIIARSASARFIGEMVHRYPRVFDALILISPTYPGGRERDLLQKRGAELEIAQSKNPNAKLDEAQVAWFFESTKEIVWTQDYFGTTPVLVLTGSEDPQVLPQDREDLVRLASANPNFQYIDLIGAGHNVLDTSKKLQPIGREAYLHIYRFLNHVLSGR